MYTHTHTHTHQPPPPIPYLPSQQGCLCTNTYLYTDIPNCIGCGSDAECCCFQQSFCFSLGRMKTPYGRGVPAPCSALFSALSSPVRSPDLSPVRLHVSWCESSHLSPTTRSPTPERSPLPPHLPSSFLPSMYPCDPTIMTSPMASPDVGCVSKEKMEGVCCGLACYCCQVACKRPGACCAGEMHECCLYSNFGE